MCIDAGANSGAANGQLTQTWETTLEALGRLFDLKRPTAHLLAKADGHGIHEMGAAHLDGLRLFAGAMADDLGQMAQRG
jgi:hypothetical protein